MIRKSSMLSSGRIRNGLFWLWALLAPVVLWAGIHWKLSHFRTAEFSIRVNRAVLSETAKRFFEERGAGQDGTALHLRMDSNSEYLAHLHRISQLSPPPVRVQELPVPPVLFVQEFGLPGPDEQYVSIAPDGRVVAYSLGIPSPGAAEPEDARAAALALAESMLPGVLRYQDRYQLSEPRVYEQSTQTGRPAFRVEWTAVHRNAPGISFVVRFRIANGEVFAQEVTASVNEEMAAAGYTHAFREILSAAAPFYFIALVVWMLARYLRRSLEHEVSHGRALMITVYLVVVVSAIFLSGDDQILLNVQRSGADNLLVSLLLVLMLGTMALLTGACYAAGEGDMRERFPRSLTSFDALLTGRIFSRNVARSFLVGLGAACWLFFLHVLVNLAFEGGVEEPGRIRAVYQLVVSEAPYLYVFLMLPMGVGMVMLLGFLAPLSVVARFGKRLWISGTLLLVMSFTNLTMLHGGYATPQALFLIIGSEVVVLLALIVAADLLSAYVCLVMASYLGLLTNAQLLTLMPGQVQWWMHSVVLLTAVVSLVLLRRGRELRDEEVRPAYARALAERQSLSRQISTAALAQRQLMVQELPEVEGFSLAAECKAARAVSGDYFDGYPLGPGRVGVLLISGAGRGLLDAMVMAFAKGFLLDHAARARSAHETLGDLLETLTSVLEPGDRFPELCYLVLDAADRTMAFSRTPGFPEPIRIRTRDEALPSVKSGGSVEAETGRTLRGGRSIRLLNGSAPLDEQTTLLVYTRGFASGLYLAGVLDVREWLRQQWTKLDAEDAATVLAKLGGAVFGRGGDWRQRMPKEDITVMVARFRGLPSGAAVSPEAPERAA